MSLTTALADFVARRPAGLLVALDFDGVLAPLQDDPEASRPLPAAAAALSRLARAQVPLALVSGRGLADLADKADPPPGTYLVGSHGAEYGRWSDGLQREQAELDADATALLAELTAAMEELVAGSTGRVEHKPTSVVLHTRTASADDATRLVAAALDLGARPGVDALRGKDVVELSVLAVTKGDALGVLRRRLAVSHLLYAGDDVTDERAFTALEPDDLTIKVGSGETSARHRVADPEEMASVLARLADLLGAPPA